jgi:hypothetical protein
MNVRRRNLGELLELARREAVPSVEVSERVAASLWSLPPPRPRDVDWSLWLACAASVAAAILVMAVAGYQDVLSMDPLAALFQPMVPTLQ